MNMSKFFGAVRETPDASRGATPPADTPPAADPPAMPPADTPAGPPAAATPATDTAPDLSFIPADFVVDGKPDFAKFTTHYQDLVAADARAKEAKAAVPEGEYDFSLAEDLKFDGLDLPEGYKNELDTQTPEFAALYGELGGILRELGAPAAAAAKVSGLLAKYEAVKTSQAYAAAKADAATLGTPEQAAARVSAVGRVLQARLPADQAQALMDMTGSSVALRALEKLVGPASGVTPTPTPPGADVENLTPFERLKRANAAGR